MVNGFSGTFYTFNCNALMSDVTSENKQRSFLMTVFHALFDLGITCFFLYITLKDSWKCAEQKRKLSIRSLIPQIFSLFSKEQRKKSSFSEFLLLFIVFIFYYFPFDSFVSNRTLYQPGPPFCWTSESYW
jgi:hypothetical protein